MTRRVPVRICGRLRYLRRFSPRMTIRLSHPLSIAIASCPAMCSSLPHPAAGTWALSDMRSMVAGNASARPTVAGWTGGWWNGSWNAISPPFHSTAAEDASASRPANLSSASSGVVGRLEPSLQFGVNFLHTFDLDAMSHHAVKTARRLEPIGRSDSLQLEPHVDAGFRTLRVSARRQVACRSSPSCSRSWSRAPDRAFGPWMDSSRVTDGRAWPQENFRATARVIPAQRRTQSSPQPTEQRSCGPQSQDLVITHLSRASFNRQPEEIAGKNRDRWEVAAAISGGVRAYAAEECRSVATHGTFVAAFFSG